MEVQLYVYDLTHGMARGMSKQFLGIQIDAVYHTSLVFGNIEYFFGAGVQTCYPGTTHHGRPMEIIPMGTTQLPLETILEYLDSLKKVYTAESYDLFAHNCNNFTNDFSMFLVGKGIPDHITSLPQKVLDTPFGQMLKPQLDASMRSVTQAPVPAANQPKPPASTQPAANGSRTAPRSNGTAATASTPYGKVMNLTSSDALDKAMSGASNTCTTIFFTSSTCAPCKLAYPTFDTLAEEHGNTLFIKVDINEARDIAMKYQIRATPTFMTFSRGTKLDEWTGADPNQLKANVERVLQHTFPPHPHTQLRVPTLQFGSLKPYTYAKVPPLEKLTAKLGECASNPSITALKSFIETRQADAREAKLPDLHSIGTSLQNSILQLPVEARFAAVDLLRCAMVDPRVSGFFAEEQDQKTISTLVTQTLDLGEACPHNLRLVTIHLASNLFTSPLWTKELLKAGNSVSPLLIQLITSSLLDAAHPTTRVAAASLAFNLAVSNYRVRREENREGLSEGEQVELAASLLEALAGEEASEEAIKVLLLALGYLVYCAPREGELMDLCSALDAKGTVSACKKQDKLAKEIVSLL